MSACDNLTTGPRRHGRGEGPERKCLSACRRRPVPGRLCMLRMSWADAQTGRGEHFAARAHCHFLQSMLERPPHTLQMTWTTLCIVGCFEEREKSYAVVFTSALACRLHAVAFSVHGMSWVPACRTLHARCICWARVGGEFLPFRSVEAASMTMLNPCAGALRARLLQGLLYCVSCHED